MTETEALESVLPMAHKITNRVAYSYGLDPKELFSEVQLMALHAVRTHNPAAEAGRTLVSWTVLVVERLLCRKLRQRKWRELYQKTHTIGNLERLSAPGFSLRQLLLEVSSDAAEAIEVAISEGVPDRAYIEMVLYVCHGWGEQQIKRVWEEVRDALNS
jgi:hypothetical protein